MRKLSYASMASLFQVTPHEAEIITQAIGKPFPPSSEFPDGIPATALPRRRKRTQERRERHKAILAIVDEAPELPSLRKMQAFLSERGFKTSHVTIKEDYRALGILASAALPPKAQQ
jgi:hypothetical protein